MSGENMFYQDGRSEVPHVSEAQSSASEIGENDSLADQEKRQRSFRRLLRSYLEQRNKRHIDQPIRFAFDLYRQGASSEVYESLIPALEERCIKQISLLEDFQIFLRGDSIPYGVKNPAAFFERKITPLSAIWNQRFAFATEQEKITALGLLMGGIFAVHSISRNYEYQRRQRNDPVIPLIICGVRSFSAQEVKEESAGFYKYFMGLTNDRGVNFQKVKAFKLPRTSSYLSSGISKEAAILFPNIHSYRLLGEPDYDHITAETRMKRITEGLGEEAHKERSIAAELTLAHPRSYFDGLLLADAILHHVDMQATQRTV